MIVTHRTCHILLGATHVVLAVLALFGDSAAMAVAAVEATAAAIYLLIAHIDHAAPRPPGE